MKMVVKTPAAVFSTASGSPMIVLTHFVCCTTHVSGPRYSQLIMETSDTESDLEVIPMKRCSGQRSKSLPFNTLRTSTTGSAPNVGNLLLQGAGQQPPTTLKVRKSKLFFPRMKMYSEAKKNGRYRFKTQKNLEQNGTMFENHRKSLIKHCERSELRLHFEWTFS